MAELDALYSDIYGEMPTGESRLSPWQRKVAALAQRLKTRPEYLDAIMRFETGGSYDPAVTNQAGSGATGLIQFMPDTAKALGTTPEALAKMTPQEQLAYVEKYLQPYAGKMDSLKDAYLAVLKPSAMGKPDWYPLYSQNQHPKAYEQNKGLDKDNKGAITVGDAWRAVARLLSPRSAAASPRQAPTLLSDDALYQHLYGRGQGTGQSGERPGPGPATGQQDIPPAALTDEALYQQLYGPQGTQRPASLVQLRPDMSEDDAIRALGYDPATIRQAKAYREGDVTRRITDPNGTLATTLRLPGIRQGLSLLRGAQEVGEGAVQLGARGARAIGLYGDADVQFHDMMARLSQADYSQNIRQGSTVDPQTGESGILQDPLRTVGGALATGGVGAPAATVARRLAQGAIAGGVAAGVQPITTDPETRYWDQKRADLLLGAAAGGVGGAAGELLGPLTRKGINAARGVIQPALQETAELAERLGIPLTYGDIRRTGAMPWLEKQLERVPFSGMGRTRRTQQETAEQAVTALETQVKARLKRTPWDSLESVQQAAQQSDDPRLARRALALLDEMRSTGDDLGAIVQASAKASVMRDVMRAHELYGQVDTLAAPLGNLQMPKTMDALQRLAGDTEDLALLSPEMRSKVVGTLDTLISYVTDPQRQDYSYGTVRKLRSRLQTIARDAQEPEVARYVGRVADAVGDDLTAFAEASGTPALVTAARRADQFYRDRVVKYREGTLAKAAENDVPDEIYQKFMRGGKDRAQYFYDGLDERGKAAVRAQLLERAQQKATQADPNVFDPVAWSKALQQEQEAAGVFFKGTQAWELDGYARLMQHLRSPKAARGGNLLPTILGGGVLGGSYAVGVPTTAAMTGLAMGASQLMLSPVGRRFLVASSRLEPGSPAYQRLLDRFLRDNPALLGTIAGQETE